MIWEEIKENGKLSRKVHCILSRLLIYTFGGKAENDGCEDYAYWRSGGDTAANEYQGTNNLDSMNEEARRLFHNMIE